MPKRDTDKPASSRAAFTINEFCAEYRLSRGMLYKLWNAGAGPRFMEIGSKRVITVEAARDWAVEAERRAGATEKAPPPENSEDEAIARIESALAGFRRHLDEQRSTLARLRSGA